MGKRLITMILIVSLLLTSCARFPDSSVIPDGSEFWDVVKELDTPEKISNYMKDNFEYGLVYNFKTQTPIELYNNKKGVCDDFAMFGAFIANYHHYETFTVQIFDWSFYSHYVAIYNEGIYSITDNQNYYFGFWDFKEIVDFVCFIRDRVWRKYIVYDFDGNIIEEVKK